MLPDLHLVTLSQRQLPNSISCSAHRQGKGCQPAGKANSSCGPEAKEPIKGSDPGQNKSQQQLSPSHQTHGMGMLLRLSPVCD